MMPLNLKHTKTYIYIKIAMSSMGATFFYILVAKMEHMGSKPQQSFLKESSKFYS